MIKPLILQRKWLFGVLESVQFRLFVFWEGLDWELYVILLQYTEICQVSLHWILCIAVARVHALKTVLFEHNIRHVGGSLTVHLGAAYRKGCRAVVWHQINPESNSYSSAIPVPALYWTSVHHVAPSAWLFIPSVPALTRFKESQKIGNLWRANCHIGLKMAS